MSDKQLQPEIIVFAGPNGSGKTTITKLAKTVGIYINADAIKKANLCSDLEAAQIAERLREELWQTKRTLPLKPYCPPEGIWIFS